MQAFYHGVLKQPLIQPNGSVGPVLYLTDIFPLYMAGLAGPAQPSRPNGMLRSWPCTAVFLSGHFFRHIVLLYVIIGRELFICSHFLVLKVLLWWIQTQTTSLCCMSNSQQCFLCKVRKPRRATVVILDISV